MFVRTLILALVLTSPSLVQAQPGGDLTARIRHDLLQSGGELKKLSLYRGANAEAAFSACKSKLECPASPEDLTRALGSRLMSTSRQITGLTSCPYTAGCFALGVKDRQPESVQVFGATEGFVGITKGRLLPAPRFAALLERYKTALPTLLDVMGQSRIVVDAGQLTNQLADRYPGILTSGFRQMIGASLDREAEYLVFGRQPRFSRVVKITRADVVTPTSFARANFTPGLGERLRTPPPKPHRPTPVVKRPVVAVPSLTVATTPQPRVGRFKAWFRKLRRTR
jgi:hypothetical protein